MRAAFLLAGLAASAMAYPAAEHDKRQSTPIITTGTQGTGNQNRIEVRDMHSKNPNQFTLLVLGLEQWKGQSQSADDTYWGIAKIHGVPRQDWNGVGQCATCNGPNVDGYCPHGDLTFPGWHRAYVSLFEQKFLEVVKGIADNWPQDNRAAMQSAASTMRWPYFDWAVAPASGQPTVPSFFTDTTLNVNAQNGARTLNNPFLTFQHNDPSKLVYQYFTDWKQTLRYPTSNDANAQSNQNGFIQTFDQQRTNVRDQIYTLLTGCDNYFQFSNINAGGQGACYGSIEGVHDTVHNNVGGLGGNGISGGHMTYLPESSFDPMFWLHHANVDRLIALWQGMHTDWSGSQTTNAANWAVPAGTQVNLDSPLYPFRRNANNWWTSNYVKNWRIFNYDYPEFTNSDGSAGAIKAAVDALYSPTATGSASAKREAEADPQAIGGILGDLTNSIGEALLTPFVAKNGSSFQYFANIVTPRFGGNGSMNVLAFMDGPSSEDVGTWSYDKNLIGSMGVFAVPGRTEMKGLAHGQIPLTSWLTGMQQKGEIKDLSESTVVPFLRKHLRMRIQALAGKTFQPSELPGFNTEIVSSTRQPEQNFLKNLASVFSDFVPLRELDDSLFNGA